MTESSISEADLIVRCQEGDEDAFRALVTRYKSRIYGLAIRMTADADDAEDIVQETFLRAFHHLENLDPARGARFWLYKVATNLALNQLRAKRRRWRSHRVLAEMHVRKKPTGDVLLREQIKQAMGRLKPGWRAAVTLVWIQGLTHREAGEVLGC